MSSDPLRSGAIFRIADPRALRSPLPLHALKHSQPTTTTTTTASTSAPATQTRPALPPPPRLSLDALVRASPLPRLLAANPVRTSAGSAVTTAVFAPPSAPPVRPQAPPAAAYDYAMPSWMSSAAAAASAALAAAPAVSAASAAGRGLREWWVAVVDGGVMVEGRLCDSAETVWHSSKIATRHDARTVSTRSGSRYRLVGPFQPSKATAPRFLVEALQAADGFPENWEQLVAQACRHKSPTPPPPPPPPPPPAPQPPGAFSLRPDALPEPALPDPPLPEPALPDPVPHAPLVPTVAAPAPASASPLPPLPLTLSSVELPQLELTPADFALPSQPPLAMDMPAAPEHVTAPVAAAAPAAPAPPQAAPQPRRHPLPMMSHSADRRPRVRLTHRPRTSSFASSLRLSNEVTDDEEPSLLMEPPDLSALPRSRSGRSIKPPLSYWANQRLKTNAKLEVEITTGSMDTLAVFGSSDFNKRRRQQPPAQPLSRPRTAPANINAGRDQSGSPVLTKKPRPASPVANVADSAPMAPPAIDNDNDNASPPPLVPAIPECNASVTPEPAAKPAAKRKSSSPAKESEPPIAEQPTTKAKLQPPPPAKAASAATAAAPAKPKGKVGRPPKSAAAKTNKLVGKEAASKTTATEQPTQPVAAPEPAPTPAEEPSKPHDNTADQPLATEDATKQPAPNKRSKRGKAGGAPDAWTPEEVARLEAAVKKATLQRKGGDIWETVAKMVGARTAAECCQQHMQQLNKPRKTVTIDESKNEALVDEDELKAKLEEHQRAIVAAKPGTLARKRNARALLELVNMNHEDDVFDSTPLREKLRTKKLGPARVRPIQFSTEKKRGGGRRARRHMGNGNATSAKLALEDTDASTTAFETSGTEGMDDKPEPPSPGLLKNFDRRTMDGYIKRTLDDQKKSRAAVGGKATRRSPRGAGKPARAKTQPTVVEMLNAKQQQLLKRGDEGAEADDEEAQDYYWSDAEADTSLCA